MTDDLVAGSLEPMAKIWAELLGVSKVDPDDNFFAIGGHSLLAVKLMAAIQEKTGLEVDLSTLFDFPTLREFCAHVSPQLAQEQQTGNCR